MNNPVRAYERSEWRSAGYRHHPCVIVWKTGVCDFRVFQTPVSVGGLQPRTSCLRHSYGVTLFRGMKPLNPCSARLSVYRQKNKRYKRLCLRMFLGIRHIRYIYKPINYTQKKHVLLSLCLNNNTQKNLFLISLCLNSFHVYSWGGLYMVFSTDTYKSPIDAGSQWGCIWGGVSWTVSRLLDK